MNPSVVNPTVVSTPDAPAAIGPYSQAMVAGGTVYCSGQIGLVPGTSALVGEDVGSQTRQAIKNLSAVLVAAGSGLDRVLQTTVYLKDMADFAAMNAVYAESFGAWKPARATVAVAGLPLGARFEIAATALLNTI